jgi:hypothetical protein
VDMFSEDMFADEYASPSSTAKMIANQVRTFLVLSKFCSFFTYSVHILCLDPIPVVVSGPLAFSVPDS